MNYMWKYTYKRTSHIVQLAGVSSNDMCGAVRCVCVTAIFLSVCVCGTPCERACNCMWVNLRLGLLLLIRVVFNAGEWNTCGCYSGYLPMRRQPHDIFFARIVNSHRICSYVFAQKKINNNNEHATSAFYTILKCLSNLGTTFEVCKRRFVFLWNLVATFQHLVGQTLM